MEKASTTYSLSSSVSLQNFQLFWCYCFDDFSSSWTQPSPRLQVYKFIYSVKLHALANVIKNLN
jgi:hypothetical protein